MKNKIPLWDNYSRYLPELRGGGALTGLLEVADKDFQLRNWLRGEGPEISERYESSICFDEDIQWFKTLVRRRELTLTCEQVKAILRVRVMWNYFDHLMMKDPNVPQEDSESELYMINHSYWEKVRQQAQYALSLIEVDKG